MPWSCVVMTFPMHTADYSLEPSPVSHPYDPDSFSRSLQISVVLCPAVQQFHHSPQLSIIHLALITPPHTLPAHFAQWDRGWSQSFKSERGQKDNGRITVLNPKPQHSAARIYFDKRSPTRFSSFSTNPIVKTQIWGRLRSNLRLCEWNEQKANDVFDVRERKKGWIWYSKKGEIHVLIKNTQNSLQIRKEKCFF